MMRLSSISWQSYLAVCVVILAITAGIHWIINDDADVSVQQAMKFDISWSGANGRIEAEKLRASIGHYLLTGKKADHDQVKIQLAIFRGRLKTWSSGQFGEFVRNDPAQTRTLEALKSTLGRIEDLFLLSPQDLDDARLLATTHEMSVLARKLGASAHEVSIANAAAIREQLQAFQSFQKWTIRALLVLGSLLLVVTIRQNFTLKTTSELAKSNARRYSFLAKHDQVTGLANRIALDEKLTQLSGQQIDRGRLCALAIDLDGFKSVNDTLGHAAGDAALRTVASQLIKIVEPVGHDTIVARVGGDEFLVVLAVRDLNWCLEDFARSILDSFHSPVHTEFGTVDIGMSIGLAETGEGIMDGTCHGLLLNADLALTDAKSAGKNRVIAYHPDLRAKLKRREMIENDLGHAIQNDQIHLAYQPQFNMASGECIGYEALMRWTHPELGTISPAEFIPLAEMSGEIVELGAFVLLTACRNAALWPDDISISVNLSIAQILREDIVATVRHALDQTGLVPERLKLEITESILISDFGHTSPILEGLQDLGVRISLDDFGTGYSGLSYLTKLSWDEIKIDRSFVVSAEESADSCKVVELIIQMAGELGANVTVEGIETQEQFALFARFGCTNAQGFYLGRPSGLGAVLHAMKRRGPKADQYDVCTHLQAEAG